MGDSKRRGPSAQCPTVFEDEEEEAMDGVVADLIELENSLSEALQGGAQNLSPEAHFNLLNEQMYQPMRTTQNWGQVTSPVMAELPPGYVYKLNFPTGPRPNRQGEMGIGAAIAAGSHVEKGICHI